MNVRSAMKAFEERLAQNKPDEFWTNVNQKGAHGRRLRRSQEWRQRTGRKRYRTEGEKKARKKARKKSGSRRVAWDALEAKEEIEAQPKPAVPVPDRVRHLLEANEEGKILLKGQKPMQRPTGTNTLTRPLQRREFKNGAEYFKALEKRKHQQTKHKESAARMAARMIGEQIKGEGHHDLSPEEIAMLAREKVLQEAIAKEPKPPTAPAPPPEDSKPSASDPAMFSEIESLLQEVEQASPVKEPKPAPPAPRVEFDGTIPPEAKAGAWEVINEKAEIPVGTVVFAKKLGDKRDGKTYAKTLKHNWVLKEYLKKIEK